MSHTLILITKVTKLLNMSNSFILPKRFTGFSNMLFGQFASENLKGMLKVYIPMSYSRH